MNQGPARQALRIADRYVEVDNIEPGEAEVCSIVASARIPVGSNTAEWSGDPKQIEEKCDFVVWGGSDDETIITFYERPESGLYSSQELYGT